MVIPYFLRKVPFFLQLHQKKAVYILVYIGHLARNHQGNPNIYINFYSGESSIDKLELAIGVSVELCESSNNSSIKYSNDLSVSIPIF